MLKGDIETVKTLARMIANEEIAKANAELSAKIEKLESDITAKASSDAITSAVKDLEAKIKKAAPAEVKPRTPESKGGK